MVNYPETFTANGTEYTAKRDINYRDGDAQIYFKRKNEHGFEVCVGTYELRVERNYDGPDSFIPRHTERSEKFVKNTGLMSPNVSDEEWAAVQAAFTASITQDDKPEPVFVPTGGGLSLEEMALAARLRWVEAGCPSGDHRDYLGEDYDEL